MTTTLESLSAATLSGHRSSLHFGHDKEDRSKDHPSGTSQSSGTLEDCQAGDKLEPIAVIGIGLRFPGEATSTESFWRLLIEGRSARSEVPRDRYNSESYHRSRKAKTGAVSADAGHFVQEDVASFDAQFFSMVSHEAECMDPMQRWLLETSYEALENAGVTLGEIKGSKTSVHIGSFVNDYKILLGQDSKLPRRYKGTGTSPSMLANRLSWFYDLTGPSMQIDTACSSSLYALHSACHGLRSGDATMAIVGGANLILSPDTMMELTDLNFLSPDGISYSFDHRANGYSRGEGIGVIILKPLSTALSDGDTIRAVIRATGINQDGKTPTITQPSSKSQQQLIRDTYTAGGLDMSTTRYFEAHGTGTAVGDPLEAEAIGAAFADISSSNDPLFIGAVKSNIGHLEGAAGMAGLIKAILALEKGVIPPNIWFEKVNPKIPTEKWNIKFPIQPASWPAKGLRRASINSFGFGGANSHVVIDDAYNYLKIREMQGRHCTKLHDSIGKTLEPKNDLKVEKELTERPRLFVWSAADEGGIQRLNSSYFTHLEGDVTADMAENEFLDSLAYSLSAKRSHLAWKSFTIASSLGRLKESLLDGISDPIKADQVQGLCFIFTGQGAQWYAMGRELLEYPVFQESLQRAEKTFYQFGSKWSLKDELMETEKTSRISEPAIAQPVSTAIQVALVTLLKTWNILPQAVIGHSSGETAAAFCIGALSEEAAWRVAYYRGLASQAMKNALGPTSLGMMAVGLSDEEVSSYLSKHDMASDDISIACINSPKSTTMSGTYSAITALAAQMQKDGIFARKLNVELAYHSRFMQSIADIYDSLMGKLGLGVPLPSNPVMYSSVTAEVINATELNQSCYWVRNMVSPVKFRQAVSRLSLDQESLSETKDAGLINHFVEIGPHSTLQGPLKETLAVLKQEKNSVYTSALLRKQSAVLTALQLAGKLHCLGYPVNITEINNRGGDEPVPPMLTNLPSYSFNHSTRYWLESRLSRNARFRSQPDHEFLGIPDPDWNPSEAKWRNVLSFENQPWVMDHVINGVALYPAAGMLVMAIEAARQLADSDRIITGYHFKDVVLGAAIVLKSDETSIESVFHLRPCGGQTDGFLAWSEFRLYTYESDSSTEVCSGFIAVEYQTTVPDEDESEGEHERKQITTDYMTESTKCSQPLPSDVLYNYLNQRGYGYGPTFQTLKNVHYSGSASAIAQLDLKEWLLKTDDTNTMPHFIHPAALDTILQVHFVAISNGTTEHLPTMVPTAFSRLWLSAAANQSQSSSLDILDVNTTSHLLGSRKSSSRIIALDSRTKAPRMTAVCQLTVLAQAGSNAQTKSDGVESLAYHLDWQPDLDLLTGKQIEAYCASEVDPKSYKSSAESMRIQKDLFARVSLFSAVRQFTPEDIAKAEDGSNGNVQAQKHFRWMKNWVEQATAADVAEIEQIASDDGYMAQLRSELVSHDSAGELVVRVIENIGDLLTGKTTAVELLFHDGLIQKFYTGLNDCLCIGQLREYIRLLSHQKPDLKILEVGAGTGSATVDLIDVLTYGGDNKGGEPRFSEYCFTDISVNFFKEAKERFKELGEKMSFKVFDVSRDPLEFGFEAGTYDIIVASNVLHATPNIVQTLSNIKKLLKPGGKLIMFELIDPYLTYANFVFGNFTGWWLSSEPDRKWSPLMTEETWNDRLLEARFSGLDISFRDYQKRDEHTRSVMITTAVDVDAPTHTDTGGNTTHTLIVSRESPIQQSVARALDECIQSRKLGTTRIIDVESVDDLELNGSVCIFLSDLDRSILSEISPEDFGRVHKMLNQASEVLWVSGEISGPHLSPTYGMINGVKRVMINDVPNVKFATLAIPRHTEAPLVVTFISQALLKLQLAKDTLGELELSVQNGLVCIPRLVQANYMDRFISGQTTSGPQTIQLRDGHDRALALSMGTSGILDTLQFRDDPKANKILGKDEVEIEVTASGLHFEDVLQALSGGTSLGTDCAGIISQAGSDSGFQKGDRVCAMTSSSLSTYARSSARCCIKVPENVSLADAAGIPSIFTAAYYAIRHIGQLAPREGILIHSGADGLGQACIQLAKLSQAEVFTTVGSTEEKQLLVNEYGIPEDHIFSNRTRDFVRGIERLTQQRGVDVIVNSLSGEALKSTWECIAPFGRFIEMGLKDVHNHQTLPMASFERNASFTALDMNLLSNHKQGVVKHLLQQVMILFTEEKLWLPRPLEKFTASEIPKAFQLLQSGKSMGKIIVTFDSNDLVQAIPSTLPRYEFDPNATYVISGGLGGLGRNMAAWMATKGARHLLLLSRHGASESSARFVEQLVEEGVTVSTPACDITDMNVLQNVIDISQRTMPLIKGCIQSSVLLKDTRFDKMTHESWKDVARVKVQGSWNLHQVLPRDMDFFIMLSSTSGIIGWHGQANYNAGNTYQDALARQLVSTRCRKAISIDLGGIREIGSVADSENLVEKLEVGGILVRPITDLHALLDYYCDPRLPMLDELRCQLVTGVATPGYLSSNGRILPQWMSRPIFSHISQLRGHQDTTGAGNLATPTVSFATTVRALKSMEGVALAISDEICTRLAKMISLDRSGVDADQPMSAYGMDSLAAVEMKAWMERSLGCQITVFELLGNQNIRLLSQSMAETCTFFKQG